MCGSTHPLRNPMNIWKSDIEHVRKMQQLVKDLTKADVKLPAGISLSRADVILDGKQVLKGEVAEAILMHSMAMDARLTRCKDGWTCDYVFYSDEVFGGKLWSCFHAWSVSTTNAEVEGCGSLSSLGSVCNRRRGHYGLCSHNTEYWWPS